MRNRILLVGVAFAVLLLGIVAWQMRPPAARTLRSGSSASGTQIPAATEVALAPLDPSPAAFAAAFQEIELMQSRLPRDRVDPAAITEVTHDPSRLFAWVRTNTRAIRYDGSLRGALGVLMDRRGNSLDRSLLLAWLLEEAGYRTRLVAASLSDDGAARVEDDAPGPAAGDATLDNQAGALRQRAAATAGLIVTAAGPLPQPSTPRESRHVWVRFYAGGQWVDADVSLSATGQSRPHTAEAEIPRDSQPTALRGGTPGGELSHSVTLRLAVERWEAGSLRESELLVLPLTGAGGPLHAATVTFAPVDHDRTRILERRVDTGAQLRQQVLKESAWSVFATTDGLHWRMGQTFDDTGQVGPAPSAGAAGRMSGATSSALGGLLGFGGDDSPPGTTVLTAIIADYEIKTPGAPVRRVRRFIFDSIGPAARRAQTGIPQPTWSEQQRAERGADLAAINDTLVACAGVPVEAYAHRFSERLTASKADVLNVYGGKSDDDSRERADNAVAFRTLEYFAASRESLMTPGLDLTEPQVYRRIIRSVPNANTSGLDVQVFADLTWNRVADTGGVGSRMVLEQGVLDTLQESAIVLRDADARPGQTTEATFAEASTQAIGVIALRDAADPRLAGYPEAARARMATDLDAGQLVVVPARPVVADGQPRVAWWRVDPATSQVVGAVDTGLLQANTDYSTTQDVNGVRIVKFYRKPGPAAREYVRDLARRKPGISQDALNHIARLVQAYIEKTGVLPL